MSYNYWDTGSNYYSYNYGSGGYKGAKKGGNNWWGKNSWGNHGGNQTWTAGGNQTWVNTDSTPSNLASSSNLVSAGDSLATLAGTTGVAATTGSTVTGASSSTLTKTGVAASAGTTGSATASSTTISNTSSILVQKPAGSSCLVTGASISAPTKVPTAISAATSAATPTATSSVDGRSPNETKPAGKAPAVLAPIVSTTPNKKAQASPGSTVLGQNNVLNKPQSNVLNKPQSGSPKPRAKSPKASDNKTSTVLGPNLGGNRTLTNSSTSLQPPKVIVRSESKVRAHAAGSGPGAASRNPRYGGPGANNTYNGPGANNSLSNSYFPGAYGSNWHQAVQNNQSTWHQRNTGWPKNETTPAFKIQEAAKSASITEIQNLVARIMGGEPHVTKSLSYTHQNEWIEMQNPNKISRVTFCLLPGLTNPHIRQTYNNPSNPTGKAKNDKESNDKQKMPEDVLTVLRNLYPTKTGDELKDQNLMPFMNGIMKQDKACRTMIPLTRGFHHEKNELFGDMLIGKIKCKGPNTRSKEWLLATKDELIASGYPSACVINDAELEHHLEKGWRCVPRTSASSINESGTTGVLKPNVEDMICIDCEMVSTVEEENALARISAVNWDGKLIFDEYVKPPHVITNYKTEFSGITADNLHNVTTSLKDAQDILFKHVRPTTVLCGHSLENDLKALRIVHPFIIDTVFLYPHKKRLPYKRGLQNLVEHVLKQSMDRLHGHSSVDDATFTMKLIRSKAQDTGIQERDIICTMAALPGVKTCAYSDSEAAAIPTSLGIESISPPALSPRASGLKKVADNIGPFSFQTTRSTEMPKSIFPTRPATLVTKTTGQSSNIIINKLISNSVAVSPTTPVSSAGVAQANTSSNQVLSSKSIVTTANPSINAASSSKLVSNDTSAVKVNGPGVIAGNTNVKFPATTNVNGERDVEMGDAEEVGTETEEDQNSGRPAKRRRLEGGVVAGDAGRGHDEQEDEGTSRRRKNPQNNRQIADESEEEESEDEGISRLERVSSSNLETESSDGSASEEAGSERRASGVRATERQNNKSEDGDRGSRSEDGDRGSRSEDGDRGSRSEVGGSVSGSEEDNVNQAEMSPNEPEMSPSEFSKNQFLSPMSSSLSSTSSSSEEEDRPSRASSGASSSELITTSVLQSSSGMEPQASSSGHSSIGDGQSSSGQSSGEENGKTLQNGSLYGSPAMNHSSTVTSANINNNSLSGNTNSSLNGSTSSGPNFSSGGKPGIIETNGLLLTQASAEKRDGTVAEAAGAVSSGGAAGVSRRSRSFQSDEMSKLIRTSSRRSPQKRPSDHICHGEHERKTRSCDSEVMEQVYKRHASKSSTSSTIATASVAGSSAVFPASTGDILAKPGVQPLSTTISGGSIAGNSILNIGRPSTSREVRIINLTRLWNAQNTQNNNEEPQACLQMDQDLEYLCTHCAKPNELFVFVGTMKTQQYYRWINVRKRGPKKENGEETEESRATFDKVVNLIPNIRKKAVNGGFVSFHLTGANPVAAKSNGYTILADRTIEPKRPASSSSSPATMQARRAMTVGATLGNLSGGAVGANTTGATGARSTGATGTSSTGPSSTGALVGVTVGGAPSSNVVTSTAVSTEKAASAAAHGKEDGSRPKYM